ncbi:MAG: hypothetical protein CMJ58_25010 [Planctomycetaceae bacterium]|nr:hypothetical protein [Planctomycetaceae bacterium]
MSRVETDLSLHVPASLETQLRAYRGRVWTIKMTEALAAAAAGFLAVYLLVFLSDRLGDTPWWIRLGAIGVATLILGVVPWFFYRWVWRRRRLEELARLLRHKQPRVGDHLLGVIELAKNPAEQARSRTLCQAAIRQVAEDARRRDLLAALPDGHMQGWATAALAAAGIVFGLVCFAPEAAGNAWARLTAPWRDTPRYTFAAVEPLPKEMIVAHGEPFALTARLQDQTRWRPDSASLQMGGQQPLHAALAEQLYEFSAPPILEPATAEVSIGDWRQSVAVTPKLRPELASIEAVATLPEYLGRPETVSRDARGGSAAFVKGSHVHLVAAANRPLTTATVDGAPLVPAGASLATRDALLEEARQVTIDWTDEYGLSSKKPFAVTITAAEDAPPTLACEDLPRRKVVLDSEQLDFRVTARDDFGVREVGLAWSCLNPDYIEHPAEGERLLGAGGHAAEQVGLQGTFSAKSQGIEPQVLELHVFATDYFPDRERVYSPPYILFVLNAEQHAIWITEQMSRWHRQALEVRDRELRLYEKNKQLRALDPAEFDRADIRREVEQQAAAESANGRRLAALTQGGEELLRQASRNPEIGVGHLERWAEMMGVLEDISANRMPSVADLLKEASKATAKRSAAPTESGPAAGQVRATAGGGPPTETPEGVKPPPQPPAVVDIESNQQPRDPNAQPGETQKKNPSSPKFTLPSTVLTDQSGKPATPPGEAPPPMDQAVQEQRDLLAEFEKVADELNEVLANLEGSTLVKRLKAASRKQYRLAGQIGDGIEGWFGRDAGHDDGEAISVRELSTLQEQSGVEVSIIMDDMQAYFERRRLVRFKTILDEMRSEDILGSLRDLAEGIKSEQGTSIALCEFWSDTLDRWAEDLVDPACSGACPGCRAKGCLPPSIVLEVLKILEGEMNLREQTRVAEQARPAVDSDEHLAEGERLSRVQDELTERIAKVIERILELPDAEADFAKELKLLSTVGPVMDEASEILRRPDTGSPAIAAETEAIELLLQARRMKPGGGGGGGSNPGGGGGGDTQDAAIALVGRGLNPKEVRQHHRTEQAIGDAGTALPAEFRAGLDRYFNELERGSQGG